MHYGKDDHTEKGRDLEPVSAQRGCTRRNGVGERELGQPLHEWDRWGSPGRVLFLYRSRRRHATVQTIHGNACLGFGEDLSVGCHASLLRAYDR